MSCNISLKKWNLEKIVEHPVIFITAKRRSGKSVLIKEILYKLRSRFFCGMVQSGTEVSNKFYGNFVPETLIFHEFNEMAISNLIDSQMDQVSKGVAKPVFLVLDDCAFDKKTMNSTCMRRLLYNGRHALITFICALQYQLDITPSVRSQIDYFIALRENLFADKLYKNFFSFINNQKTFLTVLDTVTQNYGALVLDNASHVAYPNNIFWYRASYNPNLKFKLCNPIFWKLNDSKKKKKIDREKRKKQTTNGVRLIQ